MSILQIVVVLLVLSLLPAVAVAIRAYMRYRGTRVVTCPETHKPVAVHVDKSHAAVTHALGEEELRLDSCTRWPERQHCGQECLSQIEESPEGCLVRNILLRWYAGAFCALCREPIGTIHWGDNKPAMLAPDGMTVEWTTIQPEALPAVLATHQPVCWNCHVAKTFRDLFPDLVTERPRLPERRAS